MFPKISRSTLPCMKESPGVVDLLGVLAYAELSAYARMTEDAATLAPSLADRGPADWLQALVKTYVGDGIALDFYREAARHLDPSIAKLVDEVLVDEGRSQFAVERVRAGIETDPRAGARLALWARRLVGEALSQAQQVAAARPELALLVLDADGGQADISRLFAKLTEEHGKRMAAMGI
jgi:hypothetical protein